MLKELRARQEFKRPGEIKRLAKLEAIRRQRKQHNEMRREGLVR
jgi:ribosomal protein S21